MNDPSFTPTTLGAHLRQEKLAFPLHFDCHAGNWREAIDRYWFIGTVERFEESLAWLAGAFGQAMPEIPVVNETPRPVEPDPEDVEVFLRLNALDYEIYDEIRHRLARQLGR